VNVSQLRIENFNNDDDDDNYNNAREKEENKGTGWKNREKRPSGRPRHRWENRIKVYLQEMGKEVSTEFV
jgi:hypothetical protein